MTLKIPHSRRLTNGTTRSHGLSSLGSAAFFRAQKGVLTTWRGEAIPEAAEGKNESSQGQGIDSKEGKAHKVGLELGTRPRNRDSNDIKL